MCKCKNSKSSCKWFWRILFLIWGMGFGLFMARRPGKESRKEIYDNWNKGELLAVAKWKVFLKEMMHAFKEVPVAMDEFLESEKYGEMKDKGVKLAKEGKDILDEHIAELRKHMDVKVKEAKKVIDKKMAEGKKKGEQVLKDVKKKLK